jgi:anaerobic ribonucleoside-triphosphate reductase
MNNNFTSNDLLLYHFGEADENTIKAIEIALRHDVGLQKQLNELKENTNTIKQLAQTPSDKLMDKILEAIRQEKETTSVFK